jgi:hypothetical protein
MQLRLSEPVSKKLTEAFDGAVVDGEVDGEAAGSAWRIVDGGA